MKILILNHSNMYLNNYLTYAICYQKQIICNHLSEVDLIQSIVSEVNYMQSTILSELNAMYYQK